jgi:hypothetical protein
MLDAPVSRSGVVQDFQVVATEPQQRRRLAGNVWVFAEPDSARSPHTVPDFKTLVKASADNMVRSALFPDKAKTKTWISNTIQVYARNDGSDYILGNRAMLTEGSPRCLQG